MGISTPKVGAKKSIGDDKLIKTIEEIEDKRLKLNLQFKNVIKNLSDSSEKKKEEVAQQVKELKTKAYESDTESIVLIKNYEKENTELKEQVRDLEEKVVEDGILILNLTTENVRLKSEVSILKQTVKALEKENKGLKEYIKYLEGKTASDELIILNLTSENDNLKVMIESHKNRGLIAILKDTSNVFSSLHSSASFLSSCAYQVKEDKVTVTVGKLLTFAQFQLQHMITASAEQVKSQMRKVPVPEIPRTLDAFWMTILPNKLIIPITQVDTVLENIPILKNVSGQSYKPSAESYSLQWQSRDLVGQTAFARNCGLVFTTWNTRDNSSGKQR